MARENDRTAAVLTIRDAALMSPEGKQEIARWLRRQADALKRNGRLYAPRFKARYIVIEDKKKNPPK